MKTRKSAVKKLPRKVATKRAALPTPKLGKDEHYIGAIFDAKGNGHHVILLPGDESGTWQSMLDSAKKRGGDLPNRIEQAMLFADHKDKFQEAWYWSNTQCALNAGCAWGQGFYGGGQSYDHRGNDGRARAVRRLKI